jgi:hypothetical protein
MIFASVKSDKFVTNCCYKTLTANKCLRCHCYKSLRRSERSRTCLNSRLNMFTNGHTSDNLNIYVARSSFKYNGPCHSMLSEFAAHVTLFRLADSVNNETLN